MTDVACEALLFHLISRPILANTWPREPDASDRTLLSSGTGFVQAKKCNSGLNTGTRVWARNASDTHLSQINQTPAHHTIDSVNRPATHARHKCPVVRIVDLWYATGGLAGDQPRGTLDFEAHNPIPHYLWSYTCNASASFLDSSDAIRRRA